MLSDCRVDTVWFDTVWFHTVWFHTVLVSLSGFTVWFEVVPGLVEVEVAVPRLRPAVW